MAAGLLEEVELEQLLSLVEYKLNKLHFSPPRFAWPSAYSMLRDHPLFQDIDDSRFEKLVRTLLHCARVDTVHIRGP